MKITETASIYIEYSRQVSASGSTPGKGYAATDLTSKINPGNQSSRETSEKVKDSRLLRKITISLHVISLYLATNASQACESILTCIPYLRPPCLALTQLKNFLSFSSLKLWQLPHTFGFTSFVICYSFPQIEHHRLFTPRAMSANIITSNLYANQC